MRVARPAFIRTRAAPSSEPVATAMSVHGAAPAASRVAHTICAALRRGPACAGGNGTRPPEQRAGPTRKHNGAFALSIPDPLATPPAVHDPERLAALRRTGLLDADTEEAFDRMTRLAVRLLRVPAAFISLVDEDRDFYMSAHGFGEPLASARQMTGRTFCHYAIGSEHPLVINDARADPVYRAVPTVESLGVAAYLGVPLAGPEGLILGSFCAIDHSPRTWTPDEVEVLGELAASARREIELRARARQAEEHAERLRELAAELSIQVQENRALADALRER